MEFKDRMGKELEIGDKVLYVSYGYGSPFLREGIITKKIEKEINKPYYNSFAKKTVDDYYISKSVQIKCDTGRNPNFKFQQSVYVTLKNLNNIIKIGE